MSKRKAEEEMASREIKKMKTDSFLQTNETQQSAGKIVRN